MINTIDKNINLNLYKIFYEVAKCGSISAASKKLFVSQPAVSNSIRNLEEELNVKLFYRNLKGSELTEKGKELLYYIEEALNSLMMGERKMLEDDLFSNGKLSIGVPSHIGTFFIFDQIEKFHKLYPNIEITIISRATSELIDLLEKHEIDFVIDSLPIEPVYGNLVIKKLKTVPHCFFVTSDNENVKFEDINNLSDIADLPLILPVPRSYHRKKLNEKALELGIEFSNVLSIETSEMIIGAVKRNIGIGYVLRDLIRKDLDSGIYREIKLKEDLPKVEINIVYIEKFLSKVPKQYIEKFIESK